eukprot:915003-Prorocentrum_minimum.AAC.1
MVLGREKVRLARASGSASAPDASGEKLLVDTGFMSIGDSKPRGTSAMVAEHAAGAGACVRDVSALSGRSGPQRSGATAGMVEHQTLTRGP